MLAINRESSPVLCINVREFRDYLKDYNVQVFTDGWHYTTNPITRIFNVLFVCKPIALDHVENVDTTNYPVMIQYDFYNPKEKKIVVFKNPDCAIDHFVIGDFIHMENYQVRGIISSKAYDQSLLFGRIEETMFDELANFYRMATGYHRDNYQIVSRIAQKVGMDDIELKPGTFIHIRDQRLNPMITIHKVIMTDATQTDLFFYDLAELMSANAIKRLQNQYDYSATEMTGHLETDYYVGDELIGLIGVLNSIDVSK